MVLFMDGGGMLKLKEVTSILVTVKEETVKTWKFWQEPVVDEKHVITMNYVDTNDRAMIYTASHPDRDVMIKQAKDLIEQIRQQDDMMITKELEDAIINGGTK